jgi:hypothetical protein
VEKIEGSARDWLAQAETVIDPEARTERDEAAEWLRDQLKDDPMRREEIIKKGQAAGFSKRTLERARPIAGVEYERAGFGQGSRWYLKSSSLTPTILEQEYRGANGDHGANTENKGLQHDSKPHSRHSRQTHSVGENGGANANGLPTIPDDVSADHLELCGRSVDRINDEAGSIVHTIESFYWEIPEDGRANLSSKVIGDTEWHIKEGLN